MEERMGKNKLRLSIKVSTRMRASVRANYFEGFAQGFQVDHSKAESWNASHLQRSKKRFTLFAAIHHIQRARRLDDKDGLNVRHLVTLSVTVSEQYAAKRICRVAQDAMRELLIKRRARGSNPQPVSRHHISSVAANHSLTLRKRLFKFYFTAFPCGSWNAQNVAFRRRVFVGVGAPHRHRLPPRALACILEWTPLSWARFAGPDDLETPVELQVALVPQAAALLKQGENVLKLIVPAGPVNNGVLYDYVRLELDESKQLVSSSSDTTK
jgi:hypothetical protein